MVTLNFYFIMDSLIKVLKAVILLVIAFYLIYGLYIVLFANHSSQVVSY